MLRVFILCAILLAWLGLSCLAETLSVRRRALATRAAARPHEYPFRPPISGAHGGEEDLELMDIVLLASVDGKFHALNRSSGHTLWSMSSSAFPGSAPSTLGPLVRTSHVETEDDTTDDDDSPHQELYIIEPQSGYIYIMTSPSSPLQRLAFSMSELVNMSPFSFSVGDDKRVFVGRKETSLFTLELETGKVKEVNAECPWNPFEDLHSDKHDIDLDELESSDIPKPITEISIGRTDYHIAIHTHPANPSQPKPPVQNLSFSTYGPNNRDNTIQTMYHRSADDAYVQSFPNGDIFAFKTADKPAPIEPLWINKFSVPVVAIFDVVRSANKEEPFVLLQPRPRLEDGLTNMNKLPTFASAYVGLVQETGSLFAMSAEQFPLVAFTDSNEDVHVLSSNNGAVGESIRKPCRNGASDRECLTGNRQLEESSWPWRNLLDGVPSVTPPPNAGAGIGMSMSEPNRFQQLVDNASIVPPSWTWAGDRRPLSTLLSLEDQPHGMSILASILFTACLSAMWLYRKIKPGRFSVNVVDKGVKDTQSADDGMKHAEIVPAETVDSNGTHALVNKLQDITPPAPKAVPFLRLPLPPPQSASLISDGYVFLEGDSGSDNNNNTKSIHAGLGTVQPSEDLMEGDDSEREGEGTPGKRKGPKKKRRGKKKKASAVNGLEDEDGDKEKERADNAQGMQEPKIASPSSLVISPTPKAEPVGSSLIVSDTILGFGSHGTVVFSGSLQGRAVAVKRLLQDFVTLASREVSILQESDDHPNVIRYYYQEAHANFLYIALELCPASLADIIECPDHFRDISLTFEPKRALRQITSGLRHLHSLKLVHRDIKPQNILVSGPKKNGGKDGGHRMLISDFGLCKKLDVDQTSFLPTSQGAMAAGTVGWRAPEILRGEVKLDESTGEDSQSSRGSVGTPTGNAIAGKPTRLTKLVDIFALGCLFYYTLTSGGHPFGDRFEREVNILKNVKSLDGLERFGEEGSDAAELITSMLSTEAYDRPDTSTCLLHPFFWDHGRRLNFLQDASDRFEIMCRDPRDPDLITLESKAFDIVGNDWHSCLDRVFIENLGKFRKYDGKSLQDLLRALRNKKHHYQDLPENVKRHLGPMPEGFLSYFTRRFPRLFLHVHSVVASTSLRHEPMFRTYFELAE